ncbi:hypothetical protein [Neobacillus sp. PS3-40]|jgi:TolA-binding protein|uniref:hypothetical protein n=1 Tax=Neobacillus sp. PS3-40 TaxID=3070679 RepID=UPI0027E1C720|nr:hypothetical protein [Neobacillus sp. PS3-40]WML45074.1 hypothetical protein RCG20_04010 [Neobacillus sp. PS3-40]
MINSVSQKEKLLIMMTEIYDQLEELESVLDASFSELSDKWKTDELSKMVEPEQKISNLEKKIEEVYFKNTEEQQDSNIKNQKPASLKFELGF